MHSGVFLPRDDMHKRDTCCRAGVCLSVRSSPSCIVSIRLKTLSNFFLGLVDPAFWFLEAVRCYPVPREPTQRGRGIRGGGKNCDFRLSSPFVSEAVRDRPMVAMGRW